MLAAIPPEPSMFLASRNSHSISQFASHAISVFVFLVEMCCRSERKDPGACTVQMPCVLSRFFVARSALPASFAGHRCKASFVPLLARVRLHRAHGVRGWQHLCLPLPSPIAAELPPNNAAVREGRGGVQPGASSTGTRGGTAGVMGAPPVSQAQALGITSARRCGCSIQLRFHRLRSSTSGFAIEAYSALSLRITIRRRRRLRLLKRIAKELAPLDALLLQR